MSLTWATARVIHRADSFPDANTHLTLETQRIAGTNLPGICIADLDLAIYHITPWQRFYSHANRLHRIYLFEA